MIKLSQDEEIIYRIVCDAQQFGIQSSKIGQKSQMTTQAVNKVLARLELHDFVKSFKKPETKAKLWIDFNQDPNQDLYGLGLFRKSDSDFDQIIIQKISNRIIEYLRQQKQASFKEIMLALKTLSFDKNDLTESDALKVLEMLIYKQQIEQISPNTYVLNLLYDHTPLMLNQLPCSDCQLFNQCRLGSRINPFDCQYWW